MSNDKLALTAIQAALRAGEILRKGFGTACKISEKPGVHNLVTEFDHAAENAIIKYVSGQFSDHAFLAEESGKSANLSEYVWVIDPLDGTVNFAHGIPIFAVSIGVARNQIIEVGVIYLPILNELFVAQRGFGAYLNGTKISVSKVAKLQNAFGSTGMTYHRRSQGEYLIRFANAAKLGNPFRDLGSAAVNLAYVSAGRFDAYWIDALQPWDMAAGKLLVEEAGGRVTHYDNTLHKVFAEGDNLIATNGLIHEEILQQFNVGKKA